MSDEHHNTGAGSDLEPISAGSDPSQSTNAPIQLTKHQQEMVVLHLPLARKKARAYFSWFCALSRRSVDGDTQKRDTMIMRQDDMFAAMSEALCEAARNYSPEYRSEDGNPRTFGKYCQTYMHGAAMTLFRKAMRRPAHPPAEELLSQSAHGGDKWSRPDDSLSLIDQIPDKSVIMDGSDYDGSPGEGMDPIDREHVRAAILRVVNRPGMVQFLPVREIVESLLAGYMPGELVRSDAAHARGSTDKFSVSDVETVVSLLRQELAPLLSDRRKVPMVEAMSVVKDVREHVLVIKWLKAGDFPAMRTCRGRWMVSPWTAKRLRQALDRVGAERGSDKSGSDLGPGSDPEGHAPGGSVQGLPIDLIQGSDLPDKIEPEEAH